jgi:putative colanic acid biosynthesis UDP-glucose lipid carrier transferase
LSKFKQGRYSKYLKPFSYVVDLSIINGAVYLFEINIANILLFSIYISVSWIIVSFKNDFYEVQRYSKIVQVISLLFKQIVIYALILYAFIGFFKQPNISRLALGQYFLIASLAIGFFKFLVFYLLKRYRVALGGNLRNVVVIGDTDKTNCQQIY